MLIDEFSAAVRPENAPLELRSVLQSLATPHAAPGGPSFSEELANALAGLEGLMQAADRESTKLALGAGNLHEAALALEKADVAMKLAIKARNKVVEAYQDVMRMNV